MTLKELIIKLIKEHKSVKVADVLKAHGEKVSRQYINLLMRELIAEGKVAKIGLTVNTIYVSKREEKNFQEKSGRFIKRRLVNTDLKEHEVMDNIHTLISFKNLTENIKSIFDYAFSEMLNNAIEHSHSKNIEIEVLEKTHCLEFVVSDRGVGVFKSIMKKRELNSELEAIQDLLKGKTTTQPLAHSGEGIFFTSKIAELFILESFDYRLRIDNKIKDIFIETIKPVKRGTRVTFRIALDTKKHLSDVFKKYTSGPDIGFNKTEIQVRLYTMGTIYVSRSQARRVLSELHKFKTIILDYKDVPTIGQAFADEIYRVFKHKHPEIKVESINANEAVRFMIDRVGK